MGKIVGNILSSCLMFVKFICTLRYAECSLEWTYMLVSNSYIQCTNVRETANCVEVTGTFLLENANLKMGFYF
jgi:hypothetical protein